MGLFDGILGFISGERTNAANAEQAFKNREFQANMSNTSYQRAVKDLEAAGLNPMLAYSQGGASTPAGSTAQMIDSGAAAYSAHRSATEAESSKVGQSLVKAQVDTQEAQQRDLRAAAALKEAQAEQVRVATSTAYQALDRGQLEIEQLYTTRPYWSSNAAADNMSKLIGLKQLEASFEETLQRIKNGIATESQINGTIDQIRLLIRKGELEIPGLENEAAFERSVAGNPTKFLERFAPILKALKFFLK